jgi:multidrug efflux system outer membrane protein
VRLTLVEDVATDYLQLRALDNQLAIAKQTLMVRQQFGGSEQHAV